MLPCQWLTSEPGAWVTFGVRATRGAEALWPSWGGDGGAHPVLVGMGDRAMGAGGGGLGDRCGG